MNNEGRYTALLKDNEENSRPSRAKEMPKKTAREPVEKKASSSRNVTRVLALCLVHLVLSSTELTEETKSFEIVPPKSDGSSLSK